jgi:hypothetical protein
LSKYLFEKAQQETEKLIAEGKIKLDDIQQQRLDFHRTGNPA